MAKQAIKIALNNNVDVIAPHVIMSGMSSLELRQLLNKNPVIQKQSMIIYT